MTAALDRPFSDASPRTPPDPVDLSLGVPSSRAAELARRIGTTNRAFRSTSPLGDLSSPRRQIWLIDHPVWAVLGIDGQDELGPYQALDRWCLAAHGLLQRVHAQPGRDVVMEVEEVALSPAAFLAAAAQHTDLVLVPFDAPPPVAQDPSVAWVAATLCAAHPRARTLYEELRALSVPILPTGCNSPSAACSPPDDAVAAGGTLERLRQLMEMESASATRAAEVRALHERMVRLQDEIATMADLQRRMEREVSDWRDAARVALQSAEVAEVAEGPFRDAPPAVRTGRFAQDSTRVASFEDPGRAAAARAALQALGTAYAGVSADLAESVAALSAARQDAEVWRLQAAASGDELRSVQQNLRAEQRRAELAASEQLRLVSELRDENQRHRAELDAVRQQVRRQDKAFAAESVRLRRRVSLLEGERAGMVKQAGNLSRAVFRAHAEGFLPDGDAPTPTLRSLTGAQVLAIRDQAPHRELRLALEPGPLAGLDRGPGLVKLVEHEGRAGFALMSTGGSVEPIAQWQPTGIEGRTPYMLFIPGDAAGRQALALLGTSDWARILNLAAWVEVSVKRLSKDLAPRWPAVATRLRAELLALPARLRYDQVATDLETDAIVVTFRNATFGRRHLGEVGVRWKPADPMTPIELLRRGDAAALVPGWPLREDGVPVDAWPLPWGARQPLASRLHWWHGTCGPDRDLMLALMDGLRAAVESIARADAGSPHPCTPESASRLKRRAALDGRLERLATVVLRRGR
jgi:hypothetical protein